MVIGSYRLLAASLKASDTIDTRELPTTYSRVQPMVNFERKQALEERTKILAKAFEQISEDEDNDEHQSDLEDIKEDEIEDREMRRAYKKDPHRWKVPQTGKEYIRKLKKDIEETQNEEGIQL